LLGAALVLVAGGGVLALKARAPRAAAPVVVTSAPQPLPAPVLRYTLRLESTPAGADVREGDRVLGSTPLEIAIDNEAARRAPRVLTLAKDGYAPYDVTQGASTESVRVVANLVALPPPASTVAAPAPAKHVRAAASGTATVAAPSRPDLDIRLNR
jgi:hypothetical protein